MRRNIVEEKSFGISAEKIFGSAQKADVQLDAIKWTLAREVSFNGYPIAAKTPKGPLYAIKTIAADAFPSVVVYFTVDDDPNDPVAVLRDIIPAMPD